MYKTLLRLMSGAAHETVTRTKLSQQSRDAASALARALQLLLADGDDLRPVKALLDKAASTLSRSSPDLEDARARLEGALTHERSGKKTATKKRATQFALGGRPAEPSAGKKTASKKRAASTNAAGKRQSAKGATSVTSASATSASKKRTSKKASAKTVGAGSKKTSSKKRLAKRSDSA